MASIATTTESDVKTSIDDVRRHGRQCGPQAKSTANQMTISSWQHSWGPLVVDSDVASRLSKCGSGYANDPVTISPAGL
jgi:hypothetical protein